jgi:ceramide glucosyltransferase
MLSIISVIFLSCAAVALLVYVIGMWATFRHTAHTVNEETDFAFPPITLIKPIKGEEEELEENLVSFFDQQYPAPLQMAFSSTDRDDPGIVIARRVASRYPHLEIDFVLSDPTYGLNPKVSNMHGALSAARYDIVLQSDANVRFRPGFLRKIVEEFLTKNASLLGSLVVGVGERSIGAALENLQLTGYIGPSMCAVQQVADMTCVVGKTMIFRRSELDALGGLSLVKDVLLEDFVLGETYRRASKKVVLSNNVVENINVNTTLSQFLSRHSRWLKMTAVVSKAGMAAQLFSNPLLFALLAWLTSGLDVRLLLFVLGVALFKVQTDALLVKRMRGFAMGSFNRWLSPIRDILIGLTWIYALFSRTITWRGIEMRIGRGSTICPLSPPPEQPEVSLPSSTRVR